MKNVITAIILILAMLVSLSSCLTAINKSGENVTDDKTDDIKESETETTTPIEETPATTEPNQAESNEPKEDHVVLMPEEFPEEMRKAIEENGIQDTVWVANVNGRYLGVGIGQAEEYMERILYDYYFGFPAASNIYIFDTNTNLLTGLWHAGRTTDEICSLISEDEVRILHDNLPDSLHIIKDRP